MKLKVFVFFALLTVVSCKNFKVAVTHSQASTNVGDHGLDFLDLLLQGNHSPDPCAENGCGPDSAVKWDTTAYVPILDQNGQNCATEKLDDILKKAYKVGQIPCASFVLTLTQSTKLARVIYPSTRYRVWDGSKIFKVMPCLMQAWNLKVKTTNNLFNMLLPVYVCYKHVIPPLYNSRMRNFGLLWPLLLPSKVHGLLLPALPVHI